MLIQFSVENFASYKKKAVLSLEPSYDTEHPENVSALDAYRALNTIAIYGANASGKTRLFQALTFATIIIRGSNSSQVNQALPVLPFKLDKESTKKPSKFEFIFVASDRNRYVYGFSADTKMIYEEYLYVYKTQRPTMIFERKRNHDFAFTIAMEKELRPLVQWNTENKLFLATATMWNAESTRIPFQWLAESVYTFTDPSYMYDFTIGRYKGEKSKEYVAFTERLLKKADINVAHIHFKVNKVGEDRDGFVPGRLAYGQNTPAQQEQIEVHMEHEVKGKRGKIEKYQLGIQEESLGTSQLFFMGPILKDAFDYGKTIVIDEIDRSLHTFIFKYLVDLFHNPDINKNRAQLIFTTHDTGLLSLETFRRDQIYFTEKDNDTGGSELYSLDDFPVRKKENIEKGYLLGRYGAIPFIVGKELF